jgi:hypothetical protein
VFQYLPTNVRLDSINRVTLPLPLQVIANNAQLNPPTKKMALVPSVGNQMKK